MALVKANATTTLGTHIAFEDIGASDSGKTRIFSVKSSDNDTDFLGWIKWFGRWRKYCFFPAYNTVYEQVCMREISEFIETKTREHGKL